MKFDFDYYDFILIFIFVDIQVLREKQMAVSHDLEEKQTTCQQLQTTADELEVQIDKLSEERHMVSSVEFSILSQEYLYPMVIYATFSVFSIDFCHAAAMLVREHRFRIPSLEMICMGTSSSGQKKSFGSFRIQYGRREIKANVTYCYLRYLSHISQETTDQEYICFRNP